MRLPITDKDTARMLRGRTMIESGIIPVQIGENQWRIKSQTTDQEYTVTGYDDQWCCDCPDKTFKRSPCKHIYAIRYWLDQQLKHNEDTVEVPIPIEVEPQKSSLVCVNCGNSNVVKNGTRKTRMGVKERILCKECGHTFTLGNEEGFEKMHATSKMITVALDLYFKSTSLRKIVDHLDQFYDIKVHHTTILYWVKKYSRIMSEYTETLTPNLGSIWHTDEIKIMTKREDWAWLWNVMDGETRYLVAQLVTEKRETEDATMLFRKAREHGDRPNIMITDGLQAYQDGFKNAYYTNRKDCEHVRSPGIRAKVNNNMVERLHNTIRERNKTMRGMQNRQTTTDFNEGFKAYYNHVRINSAIGKTPAQAAGINLELGHNRWQGLIHKSVEHNKAHAQ